MEPVDQIHGSGPTTFRDAPAGKEEGRGSSQCPGGGPRVCGMELVNIGAPSPASAPCVSAHEGLNISPQTMIAPDPRCRASGDGCRFLCTAGQRLAGDKLQSLRGGMHGGFARRTCRPGPRPGEKAFRRDRRSDAALRRKRHEVAHRSHPHRSRFPWCRTPAADPRGTGHPHGVPIPGDWPRRPFA